MHNPIRNITFDAHDPHVLAAFWAGATGFTLHPETGPDDDEVLLQGPDGAARLLFIQVPEGKPDEPRTHSRLECTFPPDLVVGVVAAGSRCEGGMA